ncbi:GDSL-type esterase/lipase family protein [Nitrobacter sp.]|uniref:GDSL-type esterase/lipase family protein n=1 Tax=Nitrobacter sp. TaxID=29420 RepID=UPI00399D6EB7
MRKWIGAAVVGVALFAYGAQAAHDVRIVALGASNTSGSGLGRTSGGVPSSQAYPAQLEALLRARGIHAHVTNAGVPGDTTGGMLSRLDSAVPNGTSIVILQPGGNDARRGQGGARQGNISEIRRRLSARHIKVIILGHLGQIAPRGTRDPDGQHFNARGHAAFAAWLAPKVIAAARTR